MPSNSTVIALSLLGGCTIIAAAIVYVGRPPPAPAPLDVPPPAPTPTAPPSPPPSPPREASASVRQAAQDNAAHAVLQLREQIVASCWKPPGAGEPPAIPLTFNLSFLPDGSLGGWGVSEDREVHRPDVARCVRDVPLSHLRIPAPGVPLAVEVPLTLP